MHDDGNHADRPLAPEARTARASGPGVASRPEPQPEPFAKFREGLYRPRRASAPPLPRLPR